MRTHTNEQIDANRHLKTSPQLCLPFFYAFASTLLFLSSLRAWQQLTKRAIVRGDLIMKSISKFRHPVLMTPPPNPHSWSVMRRMLPGLRVQTFLCCGRARFWHPSEQYLGAMTHAQLNNASLEPHTLQSPVLFQMLWRSSSASRSMAKL